MVPGCTGEPWKAPAWYLSSAKPATNLPFLVAPIFTRTVAPEVGPEALKTSSRDITIFTGRLALRESAMASGSRYTTVLPPRSEEHTTELHSHLKIVCPLPLA